MIAPDIESEMEEFEAWVERDDPNAPGTYMPEFDLDEGEPMPEPWSAYWLDLGGEA